ncbi:hypothetical protein C8T65DRAFT_44485 [Cerioporus squamosus]|nr:hypothetical protein C8T65DRAFT_44485 [Cerioporus squamosus]
MCRHAELVPTTQWRSLLPPATNRSCKDTLVMYLGNACANGATSAAQTSNLAATAGAKISTPSRFPGCTSITFLLASNLDRHTIRVVSHLSPCHGCQPPRKYSRIMSPRLLASSVLHRRSPSDLWQGHIVVPSLPGGSLRFSTRVASSCIPPGTASPTRSHARWPPNPVYQSLGCFSFRSSPIVSLLHGARAGTLNGASSIPLSPRGRP